MEQVNVSHFPNRLQLDSAHEKLKPFESRYIKNTRLLENANPNNNNQSGNNLPTGGNAGSITPVLSNKLVDSEFSLPTGTNKTIGIFECKELNELYWFVWNENGDHTVNVINGFTEKCTTIFKGRCLNFSIDPKHAIPDHKVWVQVTYDSQTNTNIRYVKEKELLFTDGLNNERQINVLASIGSNFFTTDYFTPVYPHYSACCDSITLAPIAPMYCPNFELIDRVEGEDGHAVDKELPNKLFNTPYQVAYNFIYIDNRTSSPSPYSLPIIVGGTDCSEQNPETLPRCAKFKFWAGNAFVNQINIYFRLAPNGAWFLYDTIDKHNCPDENVAWWNRTDAWAGMNYDVDDNTIEYTFCANKECTPIDQKLFEHIENSVPFASVSLAPAGNNLLLANCLVGSDNLTCDQLSSFEFTVTDQEDTTCVIPKRTIKMYVIIRNDSTDEAGNGHECEFLFGNVQGGTNVSIDGNFYFGGFGWRKHPTTGTKKVAIDGRSGWDSWKESKQYVPADMEEGVGGFVGYLAGTNFMAISKQVKYFQGDCDVQELGIIYRELATMYNNTGSFDDIVEALKDGEYLILQEFTFEDVPAGKYVFRVAGHRTGTELGFQSTSSYIDGSESVTSCVDGSGDPVTPALRYDYEWIIDVCDADYNALEDGHLMVLWDNTYPDFGQNVDLINKVWYNFISELYLFEDAEHTIPFEKQQLSFTHGFFKDKIFGIVHQLSDGYLVPNPLAFPLLVPASEVTYTKQRKTDHNGFVFYREQFYRRERIGSIISGIIFEFIAVFTEPKLGHITMTYTDECGTSTLDNIVVGITQVQPPPTLLQNKGYRGLKGTSFQSTGTSEQDCNRVTIRGKLLSTDGKKLAGISVGYGEGQFVRTDGFGNFKMIAHRPSDFSERCNYFMVSNTGSSCTIVCVDSEDCTLCCEDAFNEVCLPECVDCEETIIDKGILTFKKVNFPDRGLRGRYGIGVQGYDCYGRIVTGAVNIIKYIDTPECWTKHPILSWFWNGNFLLPDEVKYISFFITKNLNGTFIDWVADSFELLDANGNITTNKGQAAAVAVNLKSLLQYNVINKFNSLVSYGFVEGDILRIIDDCNNPIIYRITGTTFGTPNETALESELTVTTGGTTATSKTNFATDNGSTIIIPYDGQIDSFLEKCAIKIEINRPYACSTDQFFELCCMYPVIYGVPMNECCGGSGDSGSCGSGDTIGGVINAWDTYKIFRNIPHISGCTNNPNDEPYFSRNITDFWGAGVGSFGRIGLENPYAQRRWEGDLVCSSNARINNGVINGLGTFWNENTKNYDSQNFGTIQAMYPFRNLIGFICELDFFIADYKVPYVRQEGDRLVVSLLQQNLGEPKQKSGMNFGCLQEFTSTIICNEGIVYYYSQSDYVMCNFGEAIDIGKEGVKSWFIDKNKYLQNFNNANKDKDLFDYYRFEVISGYDPMHDEVITTVRPRNGLSTNLKSFVNECRDIRIEVGETIVYNTELKAWVNFRGYLPEYYGKLKNAGTGRQLYSFANGLPYSHNNKDGSYCTFFGNKQTPVIEITVNDTDSKVKIFQSVSQETLPINLFLDRIMTEEINSLSYLNMASWVRRENVFYGAFYRDMASYWDANFMQQSTYFEAKRIFGKLAFERLVMAHDNADKYFALNRLWTLLTGSELSMKPPIAGQPQTEK